MHEDRQNPRARLAQKAGAHASYIFIVFTLLLSACVTEPYARPPLADVGDARTGSKPNRIFAVGHGWHVGLVLPAETLTTQMPELRRRFGDVKFLELGWGDKGFYQAPNQEITFALTLQAMFWSSGTVMHVVAVPPTPVTPFDYFSASDIVELCITDVELARLNEFVTNSFLKNAGGETIRMKAGIYGDSQFYAATGRFHLMNTCNKWVAKALQSMGFDIDPAFKLTSASVLTWLKTSGRMVREGKSGVIVAPLGGVAMCEAVSRSQ